MIHQYNENQLDDWHQQRWEKFTGSENHKLLSKGRGTELFGEGAMTYIKQKALETQIRMYERPELEYNKTLLWGKIEEDYAFQWYVKTTKNYITHFGSTTPVFLDYEIPEMIGHVGVSPDAAAVSMNNGVISIDMGLEIKCPKNPMVHWERLLWKDQEDILNNCPDYYCQIQNTLMITEAPFWHFASYDGRQKDPKNRIVIIEVKPDKRYQDNLFMRLKCAIAKKKEIIEQYQNR